MLRNDVCMIVVNTEHSYQLIARRMLTPPPGATKPVTVDDSLLEELAEKTRGDWLNATDAALRVHGDYLLGTCKGRVTVAYRITGYERTELSKLRFEVEPALELTHVIGAPQPKGPWKRGEARGIRQFATPNPTQVATPENLSKGAIANADLGTWKRYVLDAAVTIMGAEEPQREPAAAWLREQWEASIDVSGVHVGSRSDGTIVVDVPAGRDVLIRTISAEEAVE